MGYKFNFWMSIFVAVFSLTIYFLASGDDPSVALATTILGGGTSLYFFIEGVIDYLGLKK